MYVNRLSRRMPSSSKSSQLTVIEEVEHDRFQLDAHQWFWSMSRQRFWTPAGEEKEERYKNSKKRLAESDNQISPASVKVAVEDFQCSARKNASNEPQRKKE